MPSIKLSLKNLSAVVSGCRRGLESLADTPDSLLSGFPSSTCGDASQIVGRILIELFSCRAKYVCGRTHPAYNEDQTHAWIEVDRFLIDVTHDQFKETGLSGWVFERQTAWHLGFQNQEVSEVACIPQGWFRYPFDGYEAALTSAMKALEQN